MNDLIERLPEGYTPGPWIRLLQNGAGPMVVREYDTGVQMRPTGLRLVCQMLQRGDTLKQDKANAALIALAPEMADEIRRLTAPLAQAKAERDALLSTETGTPEWRAMVTRGLRAAEAAFLSNSCISPKETVEVILRAALTPTQEQRP